MLELLLKHTLEGKPEQHLRSQNQQARLEAAAAAAHAAQISAAAATAANGGVPPKVPVINPYSAESRKTVARIEGDWRWGVVCLFFEHMLPLFKTQDMQEGIKAFMEKREPKFEGR